MKPHNRVARVATVVALAVLIAVPLSAWAVPGRSASTAATRTVKSHPAPSATADKKSTAKATAKAEAAAKLLAKKKLLQVRIATALANRERAFNTAADRIAERIGRVSALATSVSAAAGDVSGVTAKLDEARTILASARTVETEATARFKAVPSASDRKAAFRAAKSRAHDARVRLSDARVTLRNAILALESIVTGLEGAAQ